MRKILFLFLFFLTIAQAEDTFSVDNFEVSIFSRISKVPINLEVSMIFEGRDVEVYDFKIVDALNVVIGSFYAEDLLTSKGKISLKKALINYVLKEYSLDIDHIYIQKLTIVKSAPVDKIIKALREEGYIKK